MLSKLYLAIVNFLFKRRRFKTFAWKVWYPYLTKRLKASDVLFLNYAYIENPDESSTSAQSPQLELQPEDEKNRACINLYHQLAEQHDLKGKRVLEVSCGHGGGASFIARYHRPSHMTAVDLNREGIGFCRQRHPLPNLDFMVANAERLSLAEHSFDAVINVEASHAYGDFPAFVKEVHRVLKPGGVFLYTDFRGSNQLNQWQRELLGEHFQVIRQRDITPRVVLGMEHNSQQSDQLVSQALPFYFRFIGRVFAGVEGTRINNAMKSKQLVYNSYCLKRLP